MLNLGFRFQILIRKLVLQTGGMQFERRGGLPDRECWMKDVLSCIMGSVGSNVFGVLTHTRNWKIRYLSLCCINYDCSVFNLSLTSYTTLWGCNNKLLDYPFNLSFILLINSLAYKMSENREKYTSQRPWAHGGAFNTLVFSNNQSKTQRHSIYNDVYLSPFPFVSAFLSLLAFLPQSTDPNL